MKPIGTWGRRSQAAPAGNLARAVDAAASLAVGGGGGMRAVTGVRVPSLLRTEEILALVGLRFAVRRASNLTGIGSDGKREFGHCLHNGKMVTFEFWFPHIGVAIDTVPPPGGDAEITTKISWCLERGILYFPPGTEPETVKETVRLRREGRVAA